VKYLWRAVGIYAAFLAQSLIFENINIFPCPPDMLLTVLVIISVSVEFPAASALGAFAGILTDVMYGNVFGVKTLLYMYLALAVSIAVDKKNCNSPLIMSWICFVSIAAKEIVLAGLKAVFGYAVSISYLTASVFVKGIFGAIVTLGIVLLQQHIRNRRLNSANYIKEESV